VTSEVRAGAIVDAWPHKPYSHRTHVESRGGTLVGSFTHRYFTDLTSDGNLQYWILPYSTTGTDSQSEIYANSQQGNSSIYITGQYIETADGASTRFSTLVVGTMLTRAY